jgi:tRNA 2-(methylsulfanyl)-N6-isopentenyladenosine37 hydroxylase
MIELERRTSVEWARGVLSDPVALLVDHAYCELGAAASAQGLIHRHPDDHELGDRMAALACEELTHFRQVVRTLSGLGGRLTERTANPYAERLGRTARATRGNGPSLLDHLLVAAVIEARSYERFCLLAEVADEPSVRDLFAELGPSERGHMTLFPELARRRFGELETRGRLGEIVANEARILAELDFAPRVHSGEPVASAAPR